MEDETITVTYGDNNESVINAPQKSVDLLDLGGGDNDNNLNNVSNIVRTQTQSVMDNSSANIIDILGGVSLIDDGPKSSSAIIPKQVNSE